MLDVVDDPVPSGGRGGDRVRGHSQRGVDGLAPGVAGLLGLRRGQVDLSGGGLCVGVGTGGRGRLRCKSRCGWRGVTPCSSSRWCCLVGGEGGVAGNVSGSWACLLHTLTANVCNQKNKQTIIANCSANLLMTVWWDKEMLTVWDEIKVQSIA